MTKYFYLAVIASIFQWFQDVASYSVGMTGDNYGQFDK